MNEKEISNTFYVIRFFSLIAIVLAHSVFREIPNEIIIKILQAFARSGVVMFFIASGYYFNRKRYSNVFNMRNSKTIIIPWFIWGMVAYCTRFIKMELYFNPVEITNWVLGCGTYLWFLTILMFLRCIFQIVPNSKWLLWGAIIVTLVSTILTASNVGPFRILRTDNTALVFTYLDAYLNVFNWIGFFAIGILLRKYKVFEKYSKAFLGNKKWSVLLLLPILFIMIMTETQTSYWSYTSIFIELTFFIILLVVSININQIKIMQKIGALSMPIYLLHILIEGPIFNKILPQSIIMGILRPIITVFFIYYLLKAGLFVSKKIHMEKVYGVILGLKQ